MLNIVEFNTFKRMWVWFRIDFDWAYQYQCVDLMREYAKAWKYPDITTHGNAIQLWNQWLWKWYTRVNNSLGNKPPIGAIVFWKQWKYGHVAIAWRSNLLWMEILEQNWGRGSGDGLWNDSIRVRKDFYKNCLWWFYPN